MDPETAALPVLCISSPSGPKKQQERMAQLMFESQKVCGFYFMQQCVLSLFASGRTRGLVVEVGHGSSHAIPIFEGYALPHAALHYNAGGMDISHRLHLLLSKRGVSFHSFPLHTIDEIKESTCAMGNSTNQQGGLQNQQDETSKPFELPDGTILQVDRHTQTMSAEVLFKPQELGDEHPLRPDKGLHECAAASIAMCDKDLQTDLLNAVVLAGGTTMLPGFSRRFQDELQSVLQSSGEAATSTSSRIQSFGSEATTRSARSPHGSAAPCSHRSTRSATSTSPSRSGKSITRPSWTGNASNRQQQTSTTTVTGARVFCFQGYRPHPNIKNRGRIHRNMERQL